MKNMVKSMVVLLMGVLPMSAQGVPDRALTQVLKEAGDVYEADMTAMAIMEAKTGKLLYLSAYCRKRACDPSAWFGGYAYEPGGVIMPFVMASALEEGKISPQTHIEVKEPYLVIDGRFRLKRTDPSSKRLALREVLAFSSNIGIVKIGMRLKGERLAEGLRRFGFGRPVPSDIVPNQSGMIRDKKALKSRVVQATMSYGYGLLATPAQLMQAYSAFVNQGRPVAPYLAKRAEQEPKRAVSVPVAEELKKMLVYVVEHGTAKAAKTDGLTIGGKTATAHTVKNGRYARLYNSSFYGFVEDGFGHRYLIGTLVKEAKNFDNILASRSAVPLFKKAVDRLVEAGVLIPSGDGYLSPMPGAKIVREYGIHKDSKSGLRIFYDGVLLAYPSEDGRVRSVERGKVVEAKCQNGSCRVVIAHPDGYYSVYERMTKIAPIIRNGVRVAKGLVLGRAEVLAFWLFEKGRCVNPTTKVRF